MYHAAAGQVQPQQLPPSSQGAMTMTPSSNEPATPTGGTTLTTFLSSAYNVSVGRKTFTLGVGAGVLAGLLVGYVVFKK